MLKIEVIKFEAQDVITASTANANPNCICDLGGGCTGASHVVWVSANGTANQVCTAAPHKCGKP